MTVYKYYQALTILSATYWVGADSISALFGADMESAPVQALIASSPFTKKRILDVLESLF